LKQTVIYDLTLYLYGLSLLFQLTAFVRRNTAAKRMGTGLLLLVWLLQIGTLVVSVIKYSTEGTYATPDTLLFLSWLLLTSSFAVSRLSNTHAFVLFVNTAGFGVLAAGLLQGRTRQPIIGHWIGTDELLLVHIALAVAGYAAFALGAVLSGMYLFLHHHLKGKRLTQAIRRFPSLSELEGGAKKFTIAGLPLILASAVIGSVWIAQSGQTDLFRDPKVIGSAAIAVLYTAYLLLYRKNGFNGSMLAKWNLAAFGVVVLNYLVAGGLSAFHRWM
jgi:HemX protein